MTSMDELLAHPAAVLSDIDGTLLPRGATAIDDGTLAAIARILDAGIPFVAASGRQYASMQRLFAPVRDRIAYVCENGCISFWKGRVASRATMDQQLARAIIRHILAMQDMELMVSGVGTVYILEGRTAFRRHLEETVGNIVTAAKDIFHIPEPYFKISFFTGGHPFDLEGLKEAFGQTCKIVTGGGDWIDIMPAGISKATALQKILPLLGGR